MFEYLKTWLALKTDRRAVTALEYGLIASLIAVGIIAGFGALGTKFGTMFTTVIADLGG